MENKNTICPVIILVSSVISLCLIGLNFENYFVGSLFGVKPIVSSIIFILGMLGIVLSLSNRYSYSRSKWWIVIIIFFTFLGILVYSCVHLVKDYRKKVSH